MCAELEPLIASARDNFPDLRNKDKPVTVENNPGFEATIQVANTTACHILTSEPPYPDAYECDLVVGAPGTDAKPVVDRWTAAIAACPQLASWNADEPTQLGRVWELELPDNHELAVSVEVEREDASHAVLSVRKNEI
ncbi:MAG TPA: hypothetical protein VHE35_31425 [Kofleriaceae bacterium]|nr:hypothetical protein [Kofleriaceae bacterium]